MTTLHRENREISCVHRTVERHGGRRRRCRSCGATWTCYPRRRGPKPGRRRLASLVRTFRDRLTLTQQTGLRRTALGTLSQRTRKTLETFLHTPWPSPVAPGPLLLLIDGLWFAIDGERWVVYLMAVRSVRGNRATFLRPILRPGPESQERWQEVMDTLPIPVRTRVVALISDSFRGVDALVEQRGWALQRCQAHLLRRVANVFGTRKRTLVWAPGRDKAEALIKMLVVTISTAQVRAICQQLESLAHDPLCPAKVRGIIREVVRHHTTFRTYLRLPQLRLPATTNIMESMNSQLRAMAGRSRGFRTPEALERWIVTCVRFHSTMKCCRKTHRIK